ncbi:tyrosine-type recombinase/integrase [Salmonella enterica]|nr:tyrosine-type recombinase/integrase [Salmonella enterica]EKC2505896.1 tyrosine-type recombinase/integrase [Salmonella enterica]EKC3255703.1 tyrosine-type recombinase/integrase [Salmonella enterica]MLT74846.1 site-specific integrase [Salmonella enterica subsp. enterica serovar Sandiego]
MSKSDYSNTKDIQIRAWVRNDERFSSRAFGDGLVMRFYKTLKRPKWFYRYRFDGEERWELLGEYDSLSLADARKEAKERKARVTLGYDVAGEKADRKAEQRKKIEERRNALTVEKLCKAFYDRYLTKNKKHKEQWQRIDKNIIGVIGKVAVEDVTTKHIDKIIDTVLKRDAKPLANSVLSFTKRIFDYAVRRRIIPVSPAAAFTRADAGGEEKARKRWLTRPEIVQLFEAMRIVEGVKIEVILGLKISLALGCRKMEVFGARWDAVDFDEGILHLYDGDVKTGEEIDVPLAPLVIGWLTELKKYSGCYDYLFPTYKGKARNKPLTHGTVCNATNKLLAHMPGCKHFTPHDLRRTARSHLSALGVQSFIAERCLNHKVKGVEGVYDRHEYLEERREALEKLANLLEALEQGKDYNVLPISKGA